MKNKHILTNPFCEKSKLEFFGKGKKADCTCEKEAHTPEPWKEVIGSAVITRERLNRSPLYTGPGYAWKYIYNVSINGVFVSQGEPLLASARMRAKREQKNARKACGVEL